MDYILEMNGVSKQYGSDGFYLDHVSLALPCGAIMGLVGENGAGKTTAIGCTLNTLFKDEGIVRIFGREMGDTDTDVREEIGVIFDAGSFSEQITAGRLSRIMQGIYSRWDDALYRSYLREFKLPADKKIRSFSRGMSAKLSIAAALSHRPRLLILDEATSGLDPVVRDDILDILLDFVQDETHAILISSHITGDLEKIADYITLIHDGRIILSEKKDELIYNYAVLRCKSAQFSGIRREDILAYRRQDLHIDVLVKNRRDAERRYRDVLVDAVSIEEIMLLLVKGEQI